MPAMKTAAAAVLSLSLLTSPVMSNAFAAKTRGDGYKWDETKQNCVCDPYSGGY